MKIFVYSLSCDNDLLLTRYNIFFLKIPYLLYIFIYFIIIILNLR